MNSELWLFSYNDKNNIKLNIEPDMNTIGKITAFTLPSLLISLISHIEFCIGYMYHLSNIYCTSTLTWICQLGISFIKLNVYVHVDQLFIILKLYAYTYNICETTLSQRSHKNFKCKRLFHFTADLTFL